MFSENKRKRWQFYAKFIGKYYFYSVHNFDPPFALDDPVFDPWQGRNV